MTRAQFGEVTVAMPSRFLQDSRRPHRLAAVARRRQRRGGTQSRALKRARAPSRAVRCRGEPLRRRPRAAAQARPADPSKFPNRIPAKVRDNGDLVLAAGDRIRHDDFGEGRVDAVTGEGAKRVAHVRFDTVGPKKLLVKIAPIAKV